MSFRNGVINLVSADPFGYHSLSVSSPGVFAAETLVYQTDHIDVGVLFVDATATGTSSADAVLTPELWHSPGGDVWYLNTSLPQVTVSAGSGTTATNYAVYVKEFGPYIRMKYTLATANGALLDSSGARNQATSTLRARLSFREI